MESGQWLGFAGLVRAEASKAASAYQGRFFFASRPAPIAHLESYDQNIQSEVSKE